MIQIDLFFFSLRLCKKPSETKQEFSLRQHLIEDEADVTGSCTPPLHFGSFIYVSFFFYVFVSQTSEKDSRPCARQREIGAVTTKLQTAATVQLSTAQTEAFVSPRCVEPPVKALFFVFCFAQTGTALDITHTVVSSLMGRIKRRQTL